MSKSQIKRLRRQAEAHGKDNFAAWFICSRCATEMGGRWPDGHCATMHAGECPYCGVKAGLSALNDWLWGDETELSNWD